MAFAVAEVEAREMPHSGLRLAGDEPGSLDWAGANLIALLEGLLQATLRVRQRNLAESDWGDAIGVQDFGHFDLRSEPSAGNPSRLREYLIRFQTICKPPLGGAIL